ncbi:efflux RND transporter periplasmic adaptor subunit [bacterium]|nr:efflux RND transporter periplasmic adaptor subunit [bacterium]
MKKIVGILIVGAVLFFLGLGIAKKGQTEEVMSIAKIQKQQGIPVVATKVGSGEVISVRRYYGSVRAGKQAVVASKVMDRISDILVEAGDQVVKGETVVKFDTSATQTQIGNLSLALENAEKDYNRMLNLYESGAISQQTLDQLKLNYEMTLRNYETAHRSVSLKAPMSGVVARIDFNEGSIAFPGDAIMTIVNNGSYEVIFDVTQEDRKMLTIGQTIEVSLDNGRKIDGKISEVSYATGEMNRLFTVHAKIPGDDEIYPGMLATIDVLIGEASDVLVVPVDAVLERNSRDVLIRVKNGIADVQNVQVGLRGEESVEVIEGVQAGDIIATYGHDDIQAGEKIKIVEH